MLLMELNDPFQGSLGVTLEALQLRSFENLLERDVEDAQNEMQLVGLPGKLVFSSSSSSRLWRNGDDSSNVAVDGENNNESNSIQRQHQHQRPKYNAGNTLLFHLLTGPWAGTVRMFGEGCAWIFRQLLRLWSSITKLRLLWSWGNDQQFQWISLRKRRRRRKLLRAVTGQSQ